jgi:hypothetical protein
MEGEQYSKLNHPLTLHHGDKISNKITETHDWVCLNWFRRERCEGLAGSLIKRGTGPSPEA